MLKTLKLVTSLCCVELQASVVLNDVTAPLHQWRSTCSVNFAIGQSLHTLAVADQLVMCNNSCIEEGPVTNQLAECR